MPSIDEITQEAAYAAGDPWRPADANQIANHSAAYCDVTLKNHANDGLHWPDLNVAQQYAVVTYSAGAYTVTSGYGITAANKNSTGNVTLNIAAMLSENSYGVTIGPGPMDEAVYGIRDWSGTNTTNKVTIQLFDNSRTLVDKSFGIAIWGVPA